jgi:hypothetical protein
MRAGLATATFQQTRRSTPPPSRREAIPRSMDVRVSPAAELLREALRGCSQEQATVDPGAADGLTNPKERRSSKSAKRRLLRMIERDEQERAWLGGVIDSAPPRSPEIVDKLVRLQSIEHVEANLNRLPELDRESTFHGQ